MPQELVARHSRGYQLSASVKLEQDAEALADAITALYPSAQRTTITALHQQWQLPPSCAATLGEVFVAMRRVKQQLGLRVQDWAVSSTTLQQLFASVVYEAGAPQNVPVAAGGAAV
jgi:hypothetical protein